MFRIKQMTGIVRLCYQVGSTSLAVSVRLEQGLFENDSKPILMSLIFCVYQVLVFIPSQHRKAMNRLNQTARGVKQTVLTFQITAGKQHFHEIRQKIYKTKLTRRVADHSLHTKLKSYNKLYISNLQISHIKHTLFSHNMYNKWLLRFTTWRRRKRAYDED